MKKATVYLLILLLAIGLLGCQKDPAQLDASQPTGTQPVTEQVTEPPAPAVTEPTEPDPSTAQLLFGLGIADMEPETAYEVLSSKVRMYTLDLTVNGKVIPLTAESLELAVSQEALGACLTAMANGQEADASQILTYNEANIRRAISAQFDRAAQNAQIIYNGSSFVLEPESSGVAIGSAQAVKAAKAAIAALSPTAEAQGELKEVSPTLTMDSPQAQNAVAAANTYLNLALSYTFTPENGTTRTEHLSRSTLASFLSFDRDLNTLVSRSRIETYASSLNDKYHVPGEPGKFQATGGYTINIDVTYAGQLVDVDALRDDIYHCVTNRLSGTREAKYLPREEAGDLSFGGNYVEINQSAQHLWVYKNGKCVVSTPIVTGCVYYGWYTPNGVYTINNKAEHVYLSGVTYVRYWMAFISHIYGLHDANWRDEFGGDIYLLDGSHGCVNLPDGAAAQVYNNISIGTKVVIYGGATQADPVQQVIKGTTAYAVTAGDAPFQLDATLEYPVSELTYVSDNPAVAEVAADGTVTVKGPGTATITVSAAAAEYYTDAELQVTITVTSSCDLSGHSFGLYTQIKAPTCTEDGLEIAKCGLCDAADERPIPALGHSFTQDSAACGHGCGTQNPDYAAPTDPPVTEPDPTEPPATETDPPVTETDPPVTETEPVTPPETDPPAAESSQPESSEPAAP